MKIRNILIIFVLLLAVSERTASAAEAEQPLSRRGWQAVSDETLDSQRGGFTAANGLSISIGIEKTVVIDGTLYSVTTLTVPNLIDLNSGSEVSFITRYAGEQSGENNDPAVVVLPDLTILAGDIARLVTDAGAIIFNRGFDTMIQNDLDGKVVQVSTIINARISLMDLYREIGFMRNITQNIGTIP